MQATRVMTKARKACPSQETEFLYELSSDRSSITIYREKDGRITQTNTFKVGDMAEYDSYNLSYYAAIESITDKTVTIAKKYDSKKHRLNMYMFCLRNIDFNLARVQEENHRTSHYI